MNEDPNLIDAENNFDFSVFQQGDGNATPPTEEELRDKALEEMLHGVGGQRILIDALFTGFLEELYNIAGDSISEDYMRVVKSLIENALSQIHTGYSKTIVKGV